MLRIHLLGHPRLFEGDAPWPLPTPDATLALWAYLLLHRRQPIARDHLAYLLWPDEPEDKARANLRRHLYNLRKQLPPPPPNTPWLLTTRNTVQWNPQADDWLDVALIQEFDHTQAGETQWAALFSAYGGDLLEGLYDDWVLTERERLRQRYLRLCEQRIEQQRATGDLAGAIRTTRCLLACDPLREEPYRLLMELHYRAGDRAAALQTFEQCETMLRTELDVPPMPETLALRNRIVQGESLPSVSPLPSAASSPIPNFPISRPPSPIPSVASPRRPWIWLLPLLALTLIALLLGLWRFWPTGTPHTLSLSGPEAVQDTWLNDLYPDLLYDPQYPGDLYAAYPQVHLQYWNSPQDRVLIRFDLGQLPTSANVEQAVLHIFLEDFINQSLPEPRPATVSAFRLLTPWRPEGATFNAPWSQPGLAAGVDFEAEPLDSDSLHGSDWIDLDVTGAVRDWLTHPDRNFGLVVMITAAPQGAHYWVDTSDYPLPNRRPRLDITYIP